MYEKYYSQRLHEIHNGKVINDIYVEEFDTPNKHVVKGSKNNNPFLFVLRNSQAPITNDLVEKLLAHNKPKKYNRKSVKKRKSTGKTKRSRQSSNASKTRKKK
jgi:hypothetical protein